ncbi:hypothetical protein [Planctomicrobium sp. SH664]|uniref:hypothetical protein n=1 Tax=Planctomicrobium sp. SH664 TaxID=3448125 RepID=UPI003F5B8931
MTLLSLMRYDLFTLPKSMVQLPHRDPRTEPLIRCAIEPQPDGSLTVLGSLDDGRVAVEFEHQLSAGDDTEVQGVPAAEFFAFLQTRPKGGVALIRGGKLVPLG